ncbi:MAG TPA: TetR/AcrR family transcriptional regulator [Ruminiclostridium sp.]|nr:TetR/AcrR family transcriptional regulator [Ruminiclostridium sp.]
MDNNIDLSGLDLPDKEKRILEATIQISNEKGFSRTTTSEIAKRAGVAEGTIFRYFKTKKDILHGIMLHAIRIAADKLVLSSVEKLLDNQEQNDLRTVLKAILLDRLELVQKYFPMFRVVLSEALFHEDIRNALFENVILKIIPSITRFFDSMVETGQIRNDLQPIIIARSVLGSFITFIGQRMLFPGGLEISKIGMDIDSTLDIIINGISPQQNKN